MKSLASSGWNLLHVSKIIINLGMHYMGEVFVGHGHGLYNSIEVLDLVLDDQAIIVLRLLHHIFAFISLNSAFSWSISVFCCTQPIPSPSVWFGLGI